MTDPRDRIIDSFLALAAERDFEDIGLSDVAAQAGLSLAELRRAFAHKLDILAAFTRRMDIETLEGLDPGMAGEPARERLFDVLMRRFELLRPHREALRSIVRGLRADPLVGLAWNRVALRSATWMLEGAGIETAGWGGRMRAQGLVLAWGRAFRVFLDDDDPGLARTMAALDRRLREGERRMRRFEDIRRVGGALFGRRRRARRRPDEDEPDRDFEPRPV